MLVYTIANCFLIWDVPLAMEVTHFRCNGRCFCLPNKFHIFQMVVTQCRLLVRGGGHGLPNNNGSFFLWPLAADYRRKQTPDCSCLSPTKWWRGSFKPDPFHSPGYLCHHVLWRACTHSGGCSQSQVWWCRPLTPTFWRQRQSDCCEFEASSRPAGATE